MNNGYFWPFFVLECPVIVPEFVIKHGPRRPARRTGATGPSLTKAAMLATWWRSTRLDSARPGQRQGGDGGDVAASAAPGRTGTGGRSRLLDSQRQAWTAPGRRWWRHGGQRQRQGEPEPAGGPDLPDGLTITIFAIRADDPINRLYGQSVAPGEFAVIVAGERGA